MGNTVASRLTCVRDECLQVGAGSLVLQQLLWRHVREEDLQDHLSVLAVFGVGVPHGAVSQERLCVGWTSVERARMMKTYFMAAFTGFTDTSLITELLSKGLETFRLLFFFF